MSKQSDAKAAQRYEAKPVPATCGNCKHMTKDMALSGWMVKENAKSAERGCQQLYGDGYKREKNLRCSVGGFAVKKTAACSCFERKEVKA